MHANIIAGGTTRSRAQLIASLLPPQTELVHLTKDSTSITIKQIHSLITSLGISARFPRIVWIEEANLLTLPAQNSLLKLLEEPPANTTLYLTCHSATSLLATIRSRCHLQSVSTKAETTDPQLLLDLKSTMSLSPGDRLAGLPKMDRTTATLWFSDLEIALRHQLHSRSLTSGQLTTLAKIAKLTLAAHSQLLANCSVSLVRESFVLHLPRTKLSKL